MDYLVGTVHIRILVLYNGDSFNNEIKQKSENVILVSLVLSCPLIPQLTINHARFKSLKPDTNKKNKKDKNAFFVFRFSTPINQMLSDLIFLQQMRKMTTSGFFKVSQKY